jgi:hypothetical protein
LDEPGGLFFEVMFGIVPIMTGDNGCKTVVPGVRQLPVPAFATTGDNHKSSVAKIFDKVSVFTWHEDTYANGAFVQVTY